MRMSEIGYEGPPPIDSYGGGGFRLAGEFHEGALMLLRDGPVPWSGELTPAALAPVIDGAAGIDVLLLGMGPEIAAPPPALRAALEEAGLGLEPMSTASACRTYNVLLAEDRRVAAAFPHAPKYLVGVITLFTLVIVTIRC